MKNYVLGIQEDGKYSPNQNATIITIGQLYQAVKDNILTIDDISCQRRNATPEIKRQQYIATPFRNRGASSAGSLSFAVFDIDSIDYFEGKTTTHNCFDGLQRSSSWISFIDNKRRLPYRDSITKEKINWNGKNIGNLLFKELDEETQQQFLNFTVAVDLVQKIRYSDLGKYFTAINDGTKVTEAESRNVMDSEFCRWVRFQATGDTKEEYGFKTTSRLEMFTLVGERKTHLYISGSTYDNFKGDGLLAKMIQIYLTKGVGESQGAQNLKPLYSHYQKESWEVTKNMQKYLNIINSLVIADMKDKYKWDFSKISNLSRLVAILLYNNIEIKSKREFLKKFKLVYCELQKITQTYKKQLKQHTFLSCDKKWQIDETLKLMIPRMLNDDKLYKGSEDKLNELINFYENDDIEQLKLKV